MKIIEVARQNRDILNEGIAYVAVWQQAQNNGKRSWFSEDFHPIDSDENNTCFSDEDKARFAKIAALDADAVLLNGYYCSWLGSVDEPLNAADISNGIRKHYESHNFRITDYLEGETAETEPPAFEELQLDEREELGLGQTRRDPVGEDGMQAWDVPTTITIEIPFTGDQQILTALINSKATIIKAALGEEGFGELPIEFYAGKVAFNWLRFGADGDTIKAWSAFLAAAVKFSKTAKRVTAKDTTVENEKFAFRTFMVKLGMNGAEDKWCRRRLMQNLKGDAAFATPESKSKWQAKHLKGSADNGNAE